MGHRPASSPCPPARTLRRLRLLQLLLLLLRLLRLLPMLLLRPLRVLRPLRLRPQPRLRLLRPPASTLLLVLLLAPAAARQPAPPALQVDARTDIGAWPAVSVCADECAASTAEQLLGQPERFSLPTGTAGNLGRSSQNVWLRLPLQVDAAQGARRVLEIDYPTLNQVDVYLAQGGRVLEQHRLGNLLPYATRPLPARTHAAPLALPAGDSVVLVHVQSQTSLLLPMTLRTHESFAAHESLAQLLQGIITGLALCMLLYSLAHCVMLRDRLFLAYALLLAGNGLFMLSYFGIGSQYVWTDAPSWAPKVAPTAILLAAAATTYFCRVILAVDELSRSCARLLRAIGYAAVAMLALLLLDWIDYRPAQAVTILIGLAATVVVLPLAWVRARRGERVARYLLVGWAFYIVGVLVLVGLLSGHLEPKFSTQLVYPLSMIIEMSAWMGVLSLRVQNSHRTADRARLEAEAQRVLAQTDALTGLPNRRGLQQRLQQALAHAGPQRLLALYLADLDGFKPINDSHGHDVGDALLIAVGRRLQAQLRGSDVVARLGGDEFVVLAPGLADEAAARALGQKMLAAFEAPFEAAGVHCEVGLTIGYALAPLDSSTADELLKRADAAMYRGKQSGRRCVQRGALSLVAA